MDGACILGVSALYHDAAAAVVIDGEIVAAAQEERFSRVKNDPAVPARAIAACLTEAGVSADGITAVAYYEKPITSLVRSLKTITAIGPASLLGLRNMLEAGMGRKLFIAYSIEKVLRSLGYERPRRMLYAEHHVSHAAAAFYPSPFDRAAVLTFDGVGEWATASIGRGRGARIDLMTEQRFPASIGLLYSTFTSAAGFRVNSGEYKLMGLAPFGEPTYVATILDRLIDLRDDGSFTVDSSYFGYLAGRRMTNHRFDDLFGGPPRGAEDPITKRDCDLARSAQDVIEEIVLRVARHAHQITGEGAAVLGGGVALNCVANGRLLREGPFDEVWVQPAPGDAGSALGCALWAWHEVMAGDRTRSAADRMQGASLGPTPVREDLASRLDQQGRVFERIVDPGSRAARVAELIANGQVVAICTGRMEFGPRALGNRSILADPRSSQIRSRLNSAVKGRESFRPFAPAVLADRAAAWFELEAPSPFMSFVAPVKGADGGRRTPDGDEEAVVDLSAMLDDVRSPLPAVTHVDGSARVQTVDPLHHPELHRILTAFDELTGCPVLVNTSFNVRGEPVVADAEDAYRCFMSTEIDWLLVEDCLMSKAEQPAWGGLVVRPIPD